MGASLKPRQFRALADAVHLHTGVTMADDKVSLLTNRIRRRVRRLGLDGVDEYIGLIQDAKGAGEELVHFVDVVTTHKTSFFRTKSIWQYLLETLPSWRRDQGGLRLWSAACSSGQEAYSITMLLSHLASRGDVANSWRVVASDVSEIIANRAKSAEYTEADVEQAREVFGDRLPVGECFDVREDGTRVVGQALRSRVDFRAHNLLVPFAESFDIVFLRNVIIYFSEVDLERVLNNVLSTMSIGGLLIIGDSESMMSRTDRLEYVAPCIYRRCS